MVWNLQLQNTKIAKKILNNRSLKLRWIWFEISSSRIGKISINWLELESQSAINSHHKSCTIKPVQPSIAWIKFITPLSSFGPSLELPMLELAQISWISTLSASLIFLDLALVISPARTCNGSFNACWFSSGTNHEVAIN